MSRFNRVSCDKSITTNHEGAKAWSLDAEMALYTRVATCIRQDQFYTPNSNDELNRIKSLISQVDPEFVAQLAIYAREQMHLRTIPLVLTVELAKIKDRKPDLLRKLTKRIIQRADEITEILGYYVAANGKRERDFAIHNGVKKPLPANTKKRLFKLSKGLIKGLRDAFHKFDEYQFSKYSAENKDISMKDALFVVCPKASTTKEDELFKKIANGALKPANTWEVASSGMGQAVAAEAKERGLNEVETEALKNAKAKEMWEKRLEIKGSGQMGYMALLKNLMNFLKYDISIDHIKIVASRLSDEKEVAISKQLPFRFVTAYRMIREHAGVITSLGMCTSYGYNGRSNFSNEKIYVYDKDISNLIKRKGMLPVISNPKASILLEALEMAVKHACKNIPAFDWDTNVLIASDVSGSMRKPISTKKDGKGNTIVESKLLCYDIGLSLSMMLQHKSKVVSSGIFGNSFMVLPMPKDNILANVDMLHGLDGLVGYSTNGYLVIDYAIEAANKGIIYDKVFMFSDAQIYNDTDQRHINSEWLKFKKINPKAKLYIFDLAGYGTTPVNLRQNDVYMIAGWSENVFDMLKAIEDGSGAIEKIKKISIE